MTSQPSLYISHGSPMTALAPGEVGRQLASLAAELPRPRAIVVASAHWLAHQPEVGGAARPETVHDFYGFPPALYQIQYPAPGEPALAADILARLQQAGIPASLDPGHGLDHGAWVPLRLLFPQADIPVVPISIQPGQGPEHHFALGRALAPLRQDNVLIIGSGSITHNLHDFRAGYGQDQEAPYVRPFIQWVEQALSRNDLPALFDYRRQAPHAARSHPTDEHLLPLYFAMGAAGHDQLGAHRIDAGVDLGILAMDIYRFDGQSTQELAA